MVRGAHGAGANAVLRARAEGGPFTSLGDLVRRTHLDRRHVEALVLAGALDYMGERRQLQRPTRNRGFRQSQSFNLSQKTEYAIIYLR